MRHHWKSLAYLLAYLMVLPAIAFYRLQSRVMGAERAFLAWTEIMAMLPGTSGVFLRRAFYRSVLQECGENVTISFGTLFSHPTARLGSNVYIGSFAMIGDVTIGSDCLIGSHASVINGTQQHSIERLDIPIREQPGEFVPVRIGRDCWIGERAVVAADVGDQSVIGAGSIVTRPIPERVIAVGAPARVIRSRTEAVREPATHFPLVYS